MVLTQKGLYRLGLVTGVLVAACDTAGPDGPEVRHSQVEIDLRGLAKARLQGDAISVIDAVTLTIEPANGAEQTFEENVTLTSSPVSFPVTVETGTARFATTLVSNNGTTLYQGEETVDIQEDGFTVMLDPSPIDQVMAVSSDSVQLDAQDSAAFTVQNLGLDSLDWAVEIPIDGMGIIPSSGRVGGGGSQRVDVLGGLPSGEAVLLRFRSPEGELDAKVQGPNPIVAVAVTPDDGSATSPVFGATELTADFVIENTGNVSDTYTITCIGEGAVTCTGTSTTTVQLDRGDSAGVTAVYDFGISPTGNLILTATGTQASDQGQYEVDCCTLGIREHRQPRSAPTGSSAAFGRAPNALRIP
jgi:hypothetical protein